MTKIDPARRLLPAAGVVALLGAACPALAQGTAAQREACTPDALRLCADTIPDIAMTTACMRAHRAELSPRCRAAFATVPGADAPDAGPRRSARAPAHDDPAPPRRRARVFADRPVVGRERDPDAEIPYTPPRRVIAPPVYTYPGPPLGPYGDAYGPHFLDDLD